MFAGSRARIVGGGLLIAVTLAGCKSNDNAARRAAGKPLDDITIAMIGKSADNPVFQAARKGAEDAARDLSAKYGIHVRVDWETPSSEDADAQAKRIRSAGDNADAILVAASDAGKAAPAIDEAVAKHVAVMTFDSDVPSSKRFAHVGVDDYAAGKRAMQEASQLLGGRGWVAVLAGNAAAPNLRQRVAGAQDEARNQPGMHIVSVFNHVETPDDATAEVQRENKLHPDIQGWVFLGGWPLYAKTLVDDPDMAKKHNVSIDGLPPELVYVDKGIVPVLLAQPVYQWGYVGVQSIVDTLHLGKSVPASIPLDLVRVDKASLGTWAKQLRDWGFTDVPAEYVSR